MFVSGISGRVQAQKEKSAIRVGFGFPLFDEDAYQAVDHDIVGLHKSCIGLRLARDSFGMLDDPCPGVRGAKLGGQRSNFGFPNIVFCKGDLPVQIRLAYSVNVCDSERSHSPSSQVYRHGTAQTSKPDDENSSLVDAHDDRSIDQSIHG